MLLKILLLIIVFLYGITIGSFLNVLIYRIPKKEDFVKERSHCMECGYTLEWYDLIPIFSYVSLKGKCRKCGTKLSVQYPLIEGLNGALYVFITAVYGLTLESVLYCFMTSALIALAVIDFRTFEIPVGFNIFILLLGITRVVYLLITGGEDGILLYIIGLFAVSIPLLIIWLITKGRGIGGGDIKLMGAAGLLLGWKLILLAFAIGCILASVIHVARMKMSKDKNVSHVLAMGPYLAAGILVSALAGYAMINWYIGSLFSY